MKLNVVGPTEPFSDILTNELLPLVSKPNRYVGNELGLAGKVWESAKVRMLLSYPDCYEVGMSHTGTQILYHIVNKNPDWILDRVYAPWPDMEKLLREREMPLWGLEHRRPVRDFDLLGFTLQSELTYTNILNILDLSGIPVRQSARREEDPLVLIGGPCASNPEPLAPFVDFALIGDAEDALPEALALIEEWKESGRPGGRVGILERLALEVGGIYVPSFYEVPGKGRMARPKADAPEGLPTQVVARKVPVLKAEDHPTEMVVSLTETTHDRLPIEVMRGCMRGCRFCQAGYLYRPARERDVEEILEIAETGIKHSGWQEVSLLSLSTADYSRAPELTGQLGRTMVKQGVGVSLPSLRADAFSVGLAENVSKVRKSGFTFAPEAGSQRLRNVINKGISEEEILEAVDRAMASGWTSVKLYFMIGHPTENEQDFEELAQLVEKIRRILHKYPGRRHITLGFSPFVPKAHTPFQWERQDDIEATRKKLGWVKDRLKKKGVEIRHHDNADTAIEGVISRGGREVADVIEGAWQRGARFDGWSEHCRFDAWESAMEQCGSTLAEAFAERPEDGENPWEIVSYKVDRKYFLKERHKAYQAGLTEECKNERCSSCGVCDFDAMKNLFAKPIEAAQAAEVGVGLLQGVPGTTVRFRYRKSDDVKFLSHLDMLRELERTFRRAALPMLYSEGFSPRPKISSGPPLALGWTSDSEWIDVELAGEWPEARLRELLCSVNECAAPGVDFLEAAAMAPKVGSLSAEIDESTYEVRLPSPAFALSSGALEEGVEEFLARTSVVVERRRKRSVTQVDIRPLVREISVIAEDGVVLTLSTGAGGSVKPTEVLREMLSLEENRVPLIQIRKVATQLSSGLEPDSGAVAAAWVETSEKGNIDNGHESARNAGGHHGGWAARRVVGRPAGTRT